MSQTTLGDAVYIAGDQSGVGKTSICLGLLNALLQTYEPSEIAYIKPCTQCEGVQLLWKWCHLMGITCHGIGPIVYRPGFTQQCIDKDNEPDHPDYQNIPSLAERHQSIVDAVEGLRKTHKFVIVDGVGYPAVGSCIGCSNGQVARLLTLPVTIIGRPGIGNSIDSCVMGIEYMAYHGAPVIGVIVNKVPNKVSYHTYDRVVFYVTKFFQTYRYTIPSIASPTATTATTTATGSKHESQPSRMVSVYGFVKAFSDDDGTCATSCAVSCALKPNAPISQFDLEMDDDDYKESTRILQAQKGVDYGKLLDDVRDFFQQR